MTSARPAHLDSLAIAAPAFNEAAGIESCVADWLDALASRNLLDHAEIVVCNDGSTDATGQLLDAIARHSTVVRVVHHARNRGAARAMATAIAHTRANWVLLLDADGQFPIDSLNAFDAALRAHPDACALIGERARKHDGRFARAGAWMTTQALNALYGVHYRDLSSACQLVRGDLLRAVPIEARGLNYSVEIASRLLEAGVRPIPTRVAHRGRASGRSTRTLIRSSMERAGLVGYFAARSALIRGGVIVSTLDEVACASR